MGEKQPEKSLEIPGLERNELNVPKLNHFPSNENKNSMPFILPGDEVFVLS
ncbi:hypothetical protein J437_LFUL000691 [Ladona fulva]|uniref:Uncharacterized protein n=1 Tax=Ladona fulva TaxID=123851 RepID=A0A8K0K4G2_LADFU|nr:hypothetical protein J437_LFUL000691 [Ladona fulva]